MSNPTKSDLLADTAALSSYLTTESGPVSSTELDNYLCALVKHADTTHPDKPFATIKIK